MSLSVQALSSRLAGIGFDGERVQPLPQEGHHDLVESVDGFVYIHDLLGNVTSASRAVHAFTGYSRQELLRMNVADLLTPESLELSRRMTAKNLGSGSEATYEVSLRRKDGRVVNLEVDSRLLFHSGVPSGIISVGRDVSHSKASDANLRLLKSVVVNANDAILIAEARFADQLGGKIVYVNEAFCRMSGYQAEESVGRTPRILLGPQTDRDQLDRVRQALSEWNPVRVELINYRKDGSAYWVDVNFVPIMDEQGDFTHWVAVQRETTQRRRGEDLERDRNRVLELVARNEPLELVLGHLAQMMERQCPDLRCAVLLLREGQFEPVAGTKLPAETLREFQGLDACGMSTPQATRYRELLPGPQLGTNWPVPILSASGAVLGAFAINSGVSRRPTEAELDLLGKASRLAAIAIEQKQLTDKLAHQAQHDALTGLPNRVFFEEQLHRSLAQAKKQGSSAAVLFVDLDRFKQINDTLGHPIGDALLRQVARRLEGCIRKTDTLARMGGDEFTVLLTDLRDPHVAITVAQKLLEAIKMPVQVEGHELFVTASIGISVFPRDGRDAATLQRNADSAMYRAKNLGRNKFQMFLPEISASVLESLEIENALRKALDNNEFQLRYQPQVNLDGSMAGLEALLVWNHPKLGVIPPVQFIPVAEESGLIVPIGTWVLREACRQSAEWKQAGYPQVKMAVNVSVTQFTRPGFVEVVAQVLQETGLDPALLELELTESVVMRNVQESARYLERLRSLGISLAIDDFGTGYSSLSYLRILPIQTLKIDQSFLEEVDSDPNTLPLLRAIVALAHSLQLCVVAEGVETEAQLEALRQVDCDRIQGYLIGEPTSAIATGQLLGRSHGSLPMPANRAKNAANAAGC